MAKILNGKKLAEKIFSRLKKEIKSRQLKLRLAVISVGENPISQIFIRQKEKAAKKIGVDFKLFKLPAKIGHQKLKTEIEKIVKNTANSGVVIQLPLPRMTTSTRFSLRKPYIAKRVEIALRGEPKKFLPEDFLNLIPKEKDIDCLSEESLGKFYQNTLRILPPTVDGILLLLKNYKIKLKRKNIVIVGAGRLVGFPLATQLLKEKATLSVLNEFTKDAPFFTKKADILISGVGKANLIKGAMVKKGAVIIDAGNSIKKGKLTGDIDFKIVSKKASFLTPVPGGVGPMTVACLLKNLVDLSKKNEH